MKKILYLVNDVTGGSAGMIQDNQEEMASMYERMQRAQLIKYGAIVVSSAPVICIYPFIQKYFVKGVMIGSIKG